MNLLMVGGGNGSWQIRGVQLGAALGARVTSSPTDDDWRWADVCVLVKRALVTYAGVAQRHGVRIVWDALDFWRQPDENSTSHDDAIAMGRAAIAHAHPDLTVCATQAMADDLGGVYLAHHSRPRLAPASVRNQLTVVAYEGTPKYLGSWRTALEQACARLGLTFVVNPPDLRHADLVVAFRGERWDGPICRRWKSGVKLVNAMAAGRPIVTQPSAAHNEILPPGVAIEDVRDLESAIATYLPVEARLAAVEECRRRACEFELTAVASRYRTVLQTALRQAA